MNFTEADASSKFAQEVSVRAGRRTLAYRWLSLRSFLPQERWALGSAFGEAEGQIWKKGTCPGPRRGHLRQASAPCPLSSSQPHCSRSPASLFSGYPSFPLPIPSASRLFSSTWKKAVFMLFICLAIRMFTVHWQKCKLHEEARSGSVRCCFLGLHIPSTVVLDKC